MSSDDTEWRQYLIDKLRDRNRKEAGSFTEIISQNNRLLDSVAQLKAEKLKLSVENEQLRTAVSTGGAGKDAAGAQLAIGALEKKLLAQQEELTQLHKRKGENAQMIVDLNIKVEKLQKSLTEKERTIAEQLTANNSLRAEVEMFKNNLEGLKKLNTTLLDEHTALQLAFSALEEKLRGVQNENQLLVERLIRYKAKDADKLNEENETIRRKRKDKVKRELEDAVRDTTSGGQQFTHRNSLSPSQYLDGDDLDNGAIDLTSLAGDIEDTMGLDINTRLSLGYHGQANPTILKLKFEAHDTEAHAVRWSPVERVLATGGADRKVKLWSVGKGGTKEPKAVLGGSSASINSVDFDSTGSYVLGTSNDYGARVWTVSDSRLRHSLTGHSGKVMAAKYIHEPIKVVTGSHDRTLKIWDLRSIACIETKFAGSSCNDLVTTDSLGSIIISGHYDKKIRFWDIRTEKQADDILMPAKITSLDLSKDCNLLMCTVRDDSIRVIDLRKNQVIQTFNHDNFRIASDFARAAFDSTGTKIACGSSDGLIYIWNINGFFETTLEGHGSPVYAVSWSPHSNSLASVGKAKVCIIHSDT